MNAEAMVCKNLPKPVLDKEKCVVVFCRSGKRAATVANLLELHGWSNVINMEGGIIQWETEQGTSAGQQINSDGSVK